MLVKPWALSPISLAVSPRFVAGAIKRDREAAGRAGPLRIGVLPIEVPFVHRPPGFIRGVDREVTGTARLLLESQTRSLYASGRVVVIQFQFTFSPRVLS